MLPEGIKVLTFDCYGTIIDWETGIYEAISKILAKYEISRERTQLLTDFGSCESLVEEETPNANYRQILKHTYQRMCTMWGIEYKEEDGEEFGSSVECWPAFEDSSEALQYLKQHYRLVILSNIDKKSFAESNKKLNVEFDAIYTAEEIGTYKPNLNNFAYMIEKETKNGYPATTILHVAQSLFHDHVPAKKFNLPTVWINRNKTNVEEEGEQWGATPPPPSDIKPDFTFTSLEELATYHRDTK